MHHIADPYLVTKIQNQQEEDIRPCVGMGYCVDRVNQGKQALCGHNATTGREQILSHLIKTEPANNTKKVIIVGAGPAGLEAARVLSLRGFKVVLFEASNKLGGQLILASQGTTRQQLWGVADWLIEQVTKQGVEIRTNVYAEATDVLVEDPDLVIVATGGMPEALNIPGSELAISSWDVLYGEELSGEVIAFDDHGDQQAGVAANVIAKTGADVLFITPDRTTLHDLGPTNSSVVHRDLYKAGVSFQTDLDIVKIEKDGERLKVTLENVLTKQMQTKIVDHVVVENGTKANSDVYDDLKQDSKNNGEVDINALAEGKLILPKNNPGSTFDLVRIGDAVSSRNIHAAVYDALRVGSFY